MFNVEMKGSKAVVTRTLELPFTDVLGKRKLGGTFSIDCDIGIKPDSPAARDVYDRFLPEFRKKLEAVSKARAKEYEDIWKKADKELRPLMHDIKASQARINKLWQNFEARWQQFSTVDAVKLARPILDEAIRKTAKAQKDALAGAKVKIGLGHKDNKADRLGILKALLSAAGTAGIATAAVVAAPVAAAAGAAAFVLGGTKALRDGQRSAWKIAQRQSTDIGINLATIQSDLETAQAGLKKTGSSLELLTKNRKLLNLQIAEICRGLNAGAGTAGEAAGKAGPKELSKEAGKLKTVAKSLSDHESELFALRKQVQRTDDLIRAVRSAESALAGAVKLAKTEQTGWDGLMRRLEKTADDSSTAFDALSKLVGSLGKLA